MSRDVGSTTPSAPPRRTRLLVVDDEPDIRIVLGRGLARYGYEVSLADSGVAALAHLHRVPETDAVISDITMPAMDGNDLAAVVLDHHPGVPVLFVTASPAEPALLDHPLVGLLAKPVTLAVLHARLEELLTLAARYRQETPG